MYAEEFPDPQLIKDVLIREESKEDHLSSNKKVGSRQKAAEEDPLTRNQKLKLVGCLIMVTLMDNFIYALQSPFLPGMITAKGVQP
jgi:hypothetical protein